MILVIVVLIYLVIIGCIGSVAYQRSKNNTEDFFLASRSVGSIVFFLSLFATNMTAFAKLYGYVRHFHPSDQAARTDWETFAVEGVRKVEGASTAAEVAGLP